MPDLRISIPLADLKRALLQYFGFRSFRPNQENIIRATLDGKDVFAAMPTGGGKSLCYQLPALVTRGLTVVVSPLVSLMKDQVDAARENGVPAAFLNSTLTAEEARATWRDLASGHISLLYVSPERLSLPDFRASLGAFQLSFIAIDEAHCISEWGHEFRPDYRALSLLREEFPSVPIAAFTATATRQVQEDVIRLLGLYEPLVVRASFDRPEIFYRVEEKAGRAEERILEFVRAHPDQPGIVYRSTRKAVEKSATHLAAAGISAAAYHAGLPDDTRRERQEAFVRDEVDIIVATIAFGMGIDKPNVRWVVHGDLPRSLEGYYQETGRAARDGEDAQALLLYGRGDIAAIRWHINNMESDLERERADARLREVLAYAESSGCRRKHLLSHFDQEHPGECNRCDVCSGEVALEDMTVPAQKLLSAAVRTGERFGAHHLADIVCGNLTEKVSERGHDRLPTFGVGEDQPRQYWLSLAQSLAAGGYLQRGEGRTAGYRLTHHGRLLLRGKETFLARSPRERTGRAGQAGGKTGDELSGGAALSLADHPKREGLYRCLKQLRTRIARTRNVPPYVVFSDKTLRTMVQNRPTTRAALLRCHGVGERKLEAYGDSFLAMIRDYLASGSCSEQ